MTTKKAIEVLETEIKCVSRPDCHHQCNSCELAMELDTILDAYKMAIDGLSYKRKWSDLYQEINSMGENCRPHVDERDAGYDDACQDIMDWMEHMTGESEKLKKWPTKEEEKA